MKPEAAARNRRISLDERVSRVRVPRERVRVQVPRVRLSRVQVSRAGSAFELQEVKLNALRISASASVNNPSGDVRASFGFMPVDVRNAVIHWPAL